MDHSAEGANGEGVAVEVEPPPHKRRHVQHDAGLARRQQQLQRAFAACDEPPEDAVSEPDGIKVRPLHSILDRVSRRKGRPASYYKSRLSRDGSTEVDAWCGAFGGVTEVGAVAVDPSLAANGVAIDLPCSTGSFFTDEADTVFGPAASHTFVDVPPSLSTTANGWSRGSLREQPSRDKPSRSDTAAPASSGAFQLAVVAAAAVTPHEPSQALRAGGGLHAAVAATGATVPASVNAASAARRHAFSADVVGSEALLVHATTDRQQLEQEQQDPLPQEQEQQDGSLAAADHPPNGQQQLAPPGSSSSSEPILFTCEHCGVQLPRARDLNRHMLSHTRMHVCNHCGHRSSSAYNLRVHIRTHTGERPHACGECGQTFTQTCSLKRHALMHAAERVQTCRVCHKQFLPGLPLSKHMLKHIGEKTFICEACDSLEAPPPPTPQARARAARASAAARRQSAAAAAAAAGSSASASLDGFTAATQTPSPPASRAADIGGGGSSVSAVP